MGKIDKHEIEKSEREKLLGVKLNWKLDFHDHFFDRLKNVVENWML